MRTIEEFRWKVPARGQRRPYLSAVHLTREEALRQYGEGVEPDAATRRMRAIPETPEEFARLGHRQSAGRDGAR